MSTDNRKIKAVIFDLDNTLTDFMLAKRNAILAAADAMIDTGLQMDQKTVYDTIFKLYDEIGIEHQRVFNKFLEQEVGTVEDKVLASAVCAYRRAREAALVPYPHVLLTIHRLVKDGYKLAVVSDAPRFEAWLRLSYLRLNHFFDVVLAERFELGKIRLRAGPAHVRKVKELDDLVAGENFLIPMRPP
ncbi:HAD hydrolase-like protein [bacterium]|nr:HAD hydrolase-like protein [bacterium]